MPTEDPLDSMQTITVGDDHEPVKGPEQENALDVEDVEPPKTLHGYELTACGLPSELVEDGRGVSLHDFLNLHCDVNMRQEINVRPQHRHLYGEYKRLCPGSRVLLPNFACAVNLFLQGKPLEPPSERELNDVDFSLIDWILNPDPGAQKK